jgi:hypothetical protein
VSQLSVALALVELLKEQFTAEAQVLYQATDRRQYMVVVEEQETQQPEELLFMEVLELIQL